MLGHYAICSLPVAGRWRGPRSTDASQAIGAAPLITIVGATIRVSGSLEMGAAALATMSLAGMVIRITALIATGSVTGACIALTIFGGRPGTQWGGDAIGYAYPRETLNVQVPGISRPAVESQVPASRSASEVNRTTSRRASGVSYPTQRSAEG